MFSCQTEHIPYRIYYRIKSCFWNNKVFIMHSSQMNENTLKKKKECMMTTISEC
ncbi:hypothetical protein ACE6H2_014351 [Prunus campanulata]